MKIQNITTQSVATTEKPFRIYKEGIFFREESGFGLTLSGRRNIELETSIVDCLNDAYKQGFSEGVRLVRD